MPAGIDIPIYVDPDPVKVAMVIYNYGYEAACERWHWCDARKLGYLARKGRALSAIAGEEVKQRGGPRARRGSIDEISAMVVVEAAFALGSLRAGERAAGLRPNAGLGPLQARGLPTPAVSPAERARLSQLVLTANGRSGPERAAAARAEIARDRERERAVGEVLRIALAMVPDQPAYGRCRLPEPGPALAEALAGCDPEAIAMVFPQLGTQETRQ